MTRSRDAAVSVPAARIPRPCQDGGVADPLGAPLRLVLGDEELLVSRAVAEVVAAARAADPEADVRELAAAELAAGDLYDLLSPSLFGGRRVVVLRGAHEAKTDVVEALRALRRRPDRRRRARGRASRRRAGQGAGRRDAQGRGGRGRVRQADPGRGAAGVRPGRGRPAGGAITPERVAVLLDAVGNDLRELATACSQLVADTGGRIDADAVTRYHRGRAEVTGFAVADRAVVGDVPGALEALRWALAVGVAHVLVADALADGVRSIARVSSAGRGNPYAMASRWACRRGR